VAGEPWTAAADGVIIDVRLTPRGGRDAVEGTERRADGRTVLKVRVRAAPSEGEANAALCRTIAKALGIAPREVTLAGGATSRLKRIRLPAIRCFSSTRCGGFCQKTDDGGRTTEDR
jgi:uncharacterized protein (TIGR00251 family)